MLDANQKGVIEAIERTRQFSELNPFWIEEPTSHDDISATPAFAVKFTRPASQPVSTATTASYSSSFLRAQAIDVLQI